MANLFHCHPVRSDMRDCAVANGCAAHCVVHVEEQGGRIPGCMHHTRDRMILTAPFQAARSTTSLSAYAKKSGTQAHRVRKMDAVKREGEHDAC
eukprot:3955923-Prymnesium_polylepis.1